MDWMPYDPNYKPTVTEQRIGIVITVIAVLIFAGLAIWG